MSRQKTELREPTIQLHNKLSLLLEKWPYYAIDQISELDMNGVF